MKIIDGGKTILDGEKINEIKFLAVSNGSYKFQLWINDSLSYLNLEEALALRDMINKGIFTAIKIDKEIK